MLVRDFGSASNMAWPDGSRFLIASGVKWGEGPKFYPGPSADTPWNHVRRALCARRVECCRVRAICRPELLLTCDSCMQDLNWKDYVRHSHEQDQRFGSKNYVRRMPKEGDIHQLIHPGQPVYRPATGASAAAAPATASRSPTSLSRAGKRMLQKAHGARATVSDTCRLSMMLRAVDEATIC